MRKKSVLIQSLSAILCAAVIAGNTGKVFADTTNFQNETEAANLMNNNTYTDFTLTKDNLPIAGLTNSGDIVIPETFEYNGVNYKITAIADYTFYSCRNLTSVVIPESITSIGEYCFVNTSLTEFNVSKNLTNIGDNALANYSLVNIFVDNDNPLFCDVDGVMFTKSMKTLIQFPASKNVSEYIIPSETEVIGSSAFCKNIKIISVILSENIRKIGGSAFAYAQNLANISISSNLKEIGSFSFVQTNFKNIIIPNTVQSIGPGTFMQCYNLQNIEFPTTMDHFDGYSMFSICTSLVSAKLPENITKIDPYIFQYCNKLKSCTIPSGVTEIGYRAFQYDLNLDTVIPNSVTYLGDYSFVGNLKITSVPKNISYIGNNVFDSNNVLDYNSRSYLLSKNPNAILQGYEFGGNAVPLILPNIYAEQ